MAVATDPAIKLFGTPIPPPPALTAAEAAAEEAAIPAVVAAVGDEKDTPEEMASTQFKGSTSFSVELDQGDTNSSSCLNDDKENATPTSTQDNKDYKATLYMKAENDQAEGDTSGQEKVLKKPDKILPCPRCKSLDTKFCYYNNYNVNQPRHFCRNCQRYWTAGGAMRNVPVGAGRRKNKQPGPLKGVEAVLKFGPEAPFSGSIASVLLHREQNKSSDPSPTFCEDKSEEPSCASSVTASNCAGNGSLRNLVHSGENNFPGYGNGVTPMHPLHCHPGHPWPYPWSPDWNNIAAASMPSSQCSEVAHGQENRIPIPVAWSNPQIMGVPALCAPIPFPFVPAPWGCMPVWATGKWSLPCIGTNDVLSPTSSTSKADCSSKVSLGKHCRTTSSQGQEKEERLLWVPKTLRISDPVEASKSSIWDTLGIKPDESLLFKDLQSKTQVNGQSSVATQTLNANPAAMSRSQSFQETA